VLKLPVRENKPTTIDKKNTNQKDYLIDGDFQTNTKPSKGVLDKLFGK